jgi:hypothetical protein
VNRGAIEDAVDAIRASSEDDEAAHGLEDGLRRDFIRSLAAGEHGASVELQQLAKLVLSTEQIRFARWCA